MKLDAAGALDSEWPPVESADVSAGTLTTGGSKQTEEETKEGELALENRGESRNKQADKGLAKPFKELWRSEHQKAFERVKCLPAEAPTLAHPDFSKPFLVYSDASDYAVGGILAQAKAEGKEKELRGDKQVIGYYSKKLGTSERNYSVPEK